MTTAERITELEAQLAKKFTCFKCSDGNTPLYCLNCAATELERDSLFASTRQELREQLAAAQKERDSALAACAAKDEALRGMQHAPVGTTPCFCDKCIRIRDSLALTCGEGWKSPEDVEKIEGQRTYFLQDNQRLKAELERVCDKLDKLEAEAATVRQVWQIAKGRIHANFSHVPEAIRACDWIEIVMHKAFSSTTAGQSLLDELERVRAAVKEAYECINEWREHEFIVLDDNDPVVKLLSEALQQKGEKLP